MSRSNMKYCQLHVLGNHGTLLCRCRHALLRQHPQTEKQACKRMLPILFPGLLASNAPCCRQRQFR